MKIIIIVETYLLLILAITDLTSGKQKRKDENQSKSKTMSENEKKDFDDKVKRLLVPFTNAVNHYLKIKEWTDDLNKTRIRFENLLYGNMSQSEHSFGFTNHYEKSKLGNQFRKDDEWPWTLNLVTHEFPFDALTMDLLWLKTDVDTLFPYFQEGEDRINIINDKIQAPKTAYEIGFVEKLANQSGEGRVFCVIKQYYYDRNITLDKITKLYEGIGENLLEGIFLLAMIAEDIGQYDDPSKQLKGYGEWEMNWEWVKGNISELVKNDWFASLLHDIQDAENTLTIPVPKDRFASGTPGLPCG